MTNISIEENVVIHHVGGRALTVDIFRPAHTAGPVQSLLFLPGGGWQTANRLPLRERYGIRICEAIADAIAFFIARYVPARLAVTTA
jgi:acetyl esterase/lipase